MLLGMSHWVDKTVLFIFIWIEIIELCGESKVDNMPDGKSRVNDDVHAGKAVAGLSDPPLRSVNQTASVTHKRAIVSVSFRTCCWTGQDELNELL